MDHLVLGIGYQCGEYEATQNEWRQHGIEFDFADDFGQAMQKLSERDYVCVAVCSDCLPHDDIDALRKVRAIPIVVLPAEFNAAQRYECCNYDHGNCIALDDGEECICVQSISYSMLCKWFRSAVLLLPLDKGLETALLFRDEMKRCVTCASPSALDPTGPSIAPSVLLKPTGSRRPPAGGEGELTALAPRKGGRPWTI